MINNPTSINNETSSNINNKKLQSEAKTLSEYYSLSGNHNIKDNQNNKDNQLETSDTDISISYNISENNIENLDKKYTLIDRKNLVSRIDKIKNKKIYLKIFKIIHADNYKYTINSNGIFFNVTNLPDNILYKIDTLLDKYEKILSEKSKKINLFSNSNNVTINFN